MVDFVSIAQGDYLIVPEFKSRVSRFEVLDEK